MGKVLAYGEITITDLTDGKQIQAYVTSNQPNFVSYDPNTTTKYNPDWSASKLVLTPVIFIDNKQVSLTQTGLSITWQRKVGSAASTNIVTGENVSSGVLSVSKSMLVPNSSEMITYICSIAYTDPDTQIKAETRCQMSFTLVKQATELSDCSITGDTTFKYNGDGAITSASSITLTAVLTNTSVKQWQYKKSDGTFAAAKDITIPYSCYKGTTRIAGKATVGTLPSGITVKSNTDATASAEGSIILAVASGASLASAMSGDITISIVAAGLTSTHKFNWSKNTKATNGVNAILFQAYAPNGNHIINDSNTVLLQTTLTNGTTTVTSGVTYQWSKYVSGAYQNIASATSASLTVTPSMVDSVASFRCNAVYGGKTYSAYVSVIDQSDPCSINVLSSLGDQLINGQGAGALYVIVTRNGKEIDTLKSTTFSTSAPTKPASGDFYYKVDASAKTVTLMKYNGTAWSAATGNDLPKYTYNWTRRDKKGVELDTASNYASGKAIFLDSSVVNGKMIFGCEVVDDSE